ncbi:MAG: hypothetical protein J5801_05365 [Bacteroidales bacterium]|nr:hypothetical protein [Bacteroidales bacterium]
MKAIHNIFRIFIYWTIGVVTMSKIEKMKAIHNIFKPVEMLSPGVVTMSKVEKMSLSIA